MDDYLQLGINANIDNNRLYFTNSMCAFALKTPSFHHKIFKTVQVKSASMKGWKQGLFKMWPTWVILPWATLSLSVMDLYKG